MHIGLIGGIGPAATVFYYQRIVRAFAALAQPLHLTIAHTDVRVLLKNLTAGAAQAQAAEYQRLTEQLAAAGADFVAITSMGGHFCAPEFAAVSPLPMINGPEAVADELKRRGFKRVGMLGTRAVMETGLYGSLEGIEVVTPKGAHLDQAHEDYIAVGSTGQATPDQHDRLIGAAQGLCHDQGAEAVVLGGTDLFVVFEGGAFDFAVVDTAEVHIDAIVEAATVAS